MWVPIYLMPDSPSGEIWHKNASWGSAASVSLRTNMMVFSQSSELYTYAPVVSFEDKIKLVL